VPMVDEHGGVGTSGVSCASVWLPRSRPGVAQSDRKTIGGPWFRLVEPWTVVSGMQSPALMRCEDACDSRRGKPWCHQADTVGVRYLTRADAIGRKNADRQSRKKRVCKDAAAEAGDHCRTRDYR
jgi:hypothetical protein